MSTAPKRRLTAQEYLAQERKAAFRSEFYRGEVFAMAEASYPHNRIKENLVIEIGTQLKDGPCQSLSSDMRVKIEATGLYTYPDIVIVCDKPVFEDAVLDTLLNPLAIVEVLSESTEKYLRGAKFAQYRQVPSLQEYVLVAQNQMMVERYVRQSDGSWNLTEFSQPEAVFAYASIPVRIPLVDIYRGVTFPVTSDQ